nr:hypothetical protein Iba_chr09bCG10110 [Ipomoea batatas]
MHVYKSIVLAILTGEKISRRVVIAIGRISQLEKIAPEKIAIGASRHWRIALAVLFVISICPISSPRIAATSVVVIWTDCPFWSYNVQLLGSKFSTNHNPILRGPLYEVLRHHLPQRCHPHHLVPGCELPLLGHVIFLQPVLGGAVVLCEPVLLLFALGLSVQCLFGVLWLWIFVLVQLPACMIF